MAPVPLSLARHATAQSSLQLRLPTTLPAPVSTAPNGFPLPAAAPVTPAMPPLAPVPTKFVLSALEPTSLTESLQITLAAPAAATPSGVLRPSLVAVTPATSPSEPVPLKPALFAVVLH